MLLIINYLPVGYAKVAITCFPFESFVDTTTYFNQIHYYLINSINFSTISTSHCCKNHVFGLCCSSGRKTRFFCFSVLILVPTTEEDVIIAATTGSYFSWCVIQQHYLRQIIGHSFNFPMTTV